jgi:6-pyruvoyltetrahydropterin/6-carboxytetrahydropterin synthase
MVTDIGALDRLVEERVIKKFDKQNLSLVLNRQTVSGEDLARNIFQELAPRITQGTLTNIRLVPSRDLAYEVSA